MMRAVLYCRVSTEQQLEGISLDAQDARLASYAAAQGWEVVERICDDETGKTLHRPGIERLLSGVRNGAYDVCAVFKLDRLTRSVRDLGELLDTFSRHGVALVSLSEAIDATTAAGRLMLYILGSVAQWERETIAERTTVALRHLRTTGRAWNHPPYGYRRDGSRLVPDHGEQAAIARALSLRRDGWSLRRIAEALTRDGVPAKHGGAWRAEQVRRIIRDGEARAQGPAA
jgi:site-specific DNA recombinase